MRCNYVIRSFFVGLVILFFILLVVVILESKLSVSGHRTEYEHFTAEGVSAIASVALTIITFGGVVIGCWEYGKHVDEKKNELFSHLNKEYLKSEDIQDVVKYLQHTNPTNEKPTPYQVNIFLRFFEEMGLYLENKDIDAQKVNYFFGYYFNELLTSEKGKDLLKNSDFIIKDGLVKDLSNKKSEDWHYLNAYIEKTKTHE